MASAPQPSLPLFYQDLMPLNSRDHASWKSKTMESIKWAATQHAVPLTVEEFVLAQRDFPIVFSSGNNTVPLALMGLNEGVNTYIDDEGKAIGEFYLPAYIRRYPFMLAKLSPEAQELSLCFDPTSEAIGDYPDGEPLFDSEGNPGAPVQAALQFCDTFEQAGAKTQAFIEEISKHDLLMDGEIAITRNDDPDTPYIYRGFRMIDEEKLRNLDKDLLQQWSANGILPLLYAHLFSLDMMRIIFSRQVGQGKVPEQSAGANA
jgi:hypothetical protein